MIAKSLVSKLLFRFAVIMVLVGISTAAYPQGNSPLRVVPTETLVCLKLTNLRDFEGKITNLINSLNIPNVPPVNIAQLMGKMTGTYIESVMDLEDAGFDMKGDICVFWTSLSFDKFSIAIHVNSKELALEAVSMELGGTKKQYKGVTYTLSNAPFAWVFLDDVLVYSKDKTVIMDAIETHLNENPSILQNEKYVANTEVLRAGDISGYVALDGIVSTFLPLLQLQAEKAKGELAKQMKQKPASPPMAFDATKIVGTEMDIGLWILQQIKSYAISLGVGMDGIWVNDSVKFKSESPICDFLKISPSRLDLVKYLPGNILVAGGGTMDAAIFKKFNSVMFNVITPIMQEKMTEDKVAELREKYDVAVHDILSCLGDEVAFAVSTKSDMMMPRLVYILKVVDEAKARKTIGNLDYILEISKPFYEAFGMDFPMTEGPVQRYTGVQIKSFQMDLSKMAEYVPDAETMYPEKEFLWYAFMDDMLIYTMSQSADTIKETIDAIKGRRSSIANSPNFEDIDIRLPEKSNAVAYVSPAGYLNFVMSIIMSQMGQGMSAGMGAGAMIKPDIGFAVATNLDNDGIRNFTYILVEEIQELISTGMSFGQMINMNR